MFYSVKYGILLICCLFFGSQALLWLNLTKFKIHTLKKQLESPEYCQNFKLIFLMFSHFSTTKMTEKTI